MLLEQTRGSEKTQASGAARTRPGFDDPLWVLSDMFWHKSPDIIVFPNVEKIPALQAVGRH